MHALRRLIDDAGPAGRVITFLKSSGSIALARGDPGRTALPLSPSGGLALIARCPIDRHGRCGGGTVVAFVRCALKLHWRVQILCGERHGDAPKANNRVLS